MKRKMISLILCLLAALLLLSACGQSKIVHCDRCGKEIKLSADSNITEDWIVFCKECEAEIGPIVE